MVRELLRSVVGAERLRGMARAERRWRRALARRIEPPPEPWPRRAGSDPGAPSRYPTPTLPLHDFLAALHRQLQPRTYLEVGVNRGVSLALSRSRSIGVDPEFNVTAPLECDVRLVRMTSDEYFDSPEAVAPFGDAPVDLAFIDGMHLAEFAYRDFVNVERRCSPAGVIVLDDMLPRSIGEASRTRSSLEWTGDVYKVAEIIRQHRPDLTAIPVNTEPTGVVVVAGLDPASKVLGEMYDELLPLLQAADPQQVPHDVIERRGAADAQTLAAHPLWGRLREMRREADVDAVAAALAEAKMSAVNSARSA